MVGQDRWNSRHLSPYLFSQGFSNKVEDFEGCFIQNQVVIYKDLRDFLSFCTIIYSDGVSRRATSMPVNKGYIISGVFVTRAVVGGHHQNRAKKNRWVVFRFIPGFGNRKPFYLVVVFVWPLKQQTAK